MNWSHWAKRTDLEPVDECITSPSTAAKLDRLHPGVPWRNHAWTPELRVPPFSRAASALPEVPHDKVSRRHRSAEGNGLVSKLSVPTGFRHID